MCMPSRRRMLRSTATLLGGGVVGAVTTSRIASESASAAETALTVTGDEIEVRNEEIAAVTLDLTVNWEYAVPSGESPATLVVDVHAGTDADDLQTVASAESSQVFIESSGEESFSVDLLGEGVVERDAVVPSEGGTETTTEIVVGAEMRLLDESGMVIAADSQTDTATVTIAKDDYDPDAHGTVSGSGSVTVEVE